MKINVATKYATYPYIIVPDELAYKFNDVSIFEVEKDNSIFFYAYSQKFKNQTRSITELLYNQKLIRVQNTNDFRPSNLETRHREKQNKPNKNSKTMIRGVSFDKCKHKYRGEFMYKNKRYKTKYYNHLSDAKQAYDDLKNEVMKG
ncbi:MAG: hypothetical protein E6618_13320 [Staphylococcus warneri]|nr:hypothetical protein [Staphylococcus warneri]